MKDRIIKVRKELGLTQKEFGLNLGCSRDKISNIELGRVTVDDVFSKHISVIYNVNLLWLKTGEGDMWSSKNISPNSFLQNYEKLPPISKGIVDSILAMSERDRKVVENFFEQIAFAILDENEKNKNDN